MEEKIRKLKHKLHQAIVANDKRMINKTLTDEFKTIAMNLTGEVHGERNLFNLRMLLREIDCLNVLRRMNSSFELKTRFVYSNLTQAYHLSLFLASLGEVLRINRKPKLEQIDDIMEDIRFLLREGKKVISKHLHKMLEKETEKAIREVESRLSRVDRLLNRYLK